MVNFIDQLVHNLSSPGHQDKLGVAETKLLHTLHWMLLEAAQECHQEPGLGHGWSGGSSGGSSAYLQPIGNQGLIDRNGSTTEENEYARAKLYHKNMATVELFVFLFAPLINRIKVRTFTVDIIYFFSAGLNNTDVLLAQGQCERVHGSCCIAAENFTAFILCIHFNALVFHYLFYIVGVHFFDLSLDNVI